MPLSVFTPLILLSLVEIRHGVELVHSVIYRCYFELVSPFLRRAATGGVNSKKVEGLRWRYFRVDICFLPRGVEGGDEEVRYTGVDGECGGEYLCTVDKEGYCLVVSVEAASN